MTNQANQARQVIAEFLPLGAIVHTFNVDGSNIVQSFGSAEEYQKHNEPYFGETIGRVANRIAGARINHLNGQQYNLPANNGSNCLHGGISGWGKKLWDGPVHMDRQGQKVVRFQYKSKDDEEGFPGEVQSTVWYSQRVERSANGEAVSVLEIEYECELLGGDVEETVVGMTNHSYFNLTGEATIEGTLVKLATDIHLPVDDGLIPTGSMAPYPGNFAAQKFTLGPEEPEIDHCFVMNTEQDTIPIDTRDLDLQELASFYHSSSRIHLEVHSTEPAFQFYTGKYIDVPAVGRLPARGKRSGFCVEPSRYINAVNQSDWAHMVVLRKDRMYGSRTVYRAWRETTHETSSSQG